MPSKLWGDPVKRMQCDVLVVGGGGAGLMSAYGAAVNNAKVIVAGKGKVQRSGATVMAPGAISAVDDRWKKEGDSREIHFEDTVWGGCFMNSQELVRILCERSPGLVLELERMGALFQRKRTELPTCCASTEGTGSPAVRSWRTEPGRKC